MYVVIVKLVGGKVCLRLALLLRSGIGVINCESMGESSPLSQEGRSFFDGHWGKRRIPYSLGLLPK